MTMFFKAFVLSFACAAILITVLCGLSVALDYAIGNMWQREAKVFLGIISGALCFVISLFLYISSKFGW